MADTSTAEGNPPFDRQVRIREVVDRIRQKTNAGQAWNLDALCDQHPTLLPELKDELLKLQVTLDGKRMTEDLMPHAKSLGGYEIFEMIGRGGMGVVYKARQLSLDRIVALKMIRAGELASSDHIQRFRSEALSVAQLQHPGIVALYESGEDTGRHYFSMEYVEGKTLAAAASEHPYSGVAAARCIITIAEAVHYAHTKGIVHRDLKPSNVLIGADGRPRVTDFGLAKRMNVVADDLTLTNQVLGTPSYMPPEQADGRSPRLGPTTDVYSLGAILYELLTGRPPFRADTPVETLIQVKTNDPVDPRRLNPTTPPDLETICLKCLAKEPTRRYSTAQALAEDLERFLAGDPILARPVTWSERAWLRIKKRPVLAGLIAATLLGFVLAITFAWRGTLLAKNLAETSTTVKNRDVSLGQRLRELDETRKAKSMAESEVRSKAKEIETEKELASRSAREASLRLKSAYASDLRLAHDRVMEGRNAEALKILQAYSAETKESLRHVEWNLISAMLSGQADRVITLDYRGGNFKSTVLFAAFNADGRYLAFSYDGMVEIWDWSQQTRLAKIPVPALPWRVAFHPTREELAIAIGSGGTTRFDRVPFVGPQRHREVVIVDFKGNTLRRFEPNYPGDLIHGLAYSSDGNHVALAARDCNSIEVFNTNDGGWYGVHSVCLGGLRFVEVPDGVRSHYNINGRSVLQFFTRQDKSQPISWVTFDGEKLVPSATISFAANGDDSPLEQSNYVEGWDGASIIPMDIKLSVRNPPARVAFRTNVSQRLAFATDRELTSDGNQRFGKEFSAHSPLMGNFSPAISADDALFAAAMGDTLFVGSTMTNAAVVSKRWTVASRSFGRPGVGTRPVFCPDGQWLVTCGDGQVFGWKMQDFVADGRSWSLAMRGIHAVEESRFLYVDEDKQLEVRAADSSDLRQTTLLGTLPREFVLTQPVIDPTSLRAAGITGNFRLDAALADLRDRQQRILVADIQKRSLLLDLPYPLPNGAHARIQALTGKGNLVVVSTGMRVDAFNVEQQKKVFTISEFAQQRGQSLEAVCASMDGKLIAVTGRKNTTGSTLIWFDAATGERLGEHDFAGFGFGSLDFSPDNRLIAAQRGTAELLLVDLHSKTSRSLERTEGRLEDGLQFSLDGRRLLVGCRIFDCETGINLLQLPAGDARPDLLRILAKAFMLAKPRTGACLRTGWSDPDSIGSANASLAPQSVTRAPAAGISPTSIAVKPEAPPSPPSTEAKPKSQPAPPPDLTPSRPESLPERSQDSPKVDLVAPQVEGETFRAGSSLTGSRTYRKGAWAGKTVPYELHIRTRDGEKFTGHVFDNGVGKNRADVVGEIRGLAITWREKPPGGGVVTVEGAIAGDKLEINFTRKRANGAQLTQGVGVLRIHK